MTYLTEIAAEIAGLEKWQRVALAAMCAESLSPVIARFAQPDTQRAFEQGLDCAWKSVRNESLDSRALAARATLNDLHESTCDDSNIPAYEVMIVLSILAYTLDSILENDSARCVTDACTAATDQYSGYDYVLTTGNQARKIDPCNPPPPGRLESLLIQTQFRSIQVTRSIGKPQSDLVEEMQTLAKQLATEIERVLPTIAEKRGWNTNLH